MPELHASRVVPASNKMMRNMADSGAKFGRSLRVRFVASLGVACVLALLPVAMSAQTPKKCKPGSKDAACQTPPASPDSSAPSAPPAAAFPFPTEDSRHGGDVDGGPPAAPPAPAKNPNGLPAMPSGNDADPPEESNRRLKLPKDGYSTGDSSSSDAPADGGGTSSSSSSSSSASGTDEDDDVAPTTASPDAPVKASALKDLGSKGSLSAARAKLEATRFQDDMKVGKFYMQDGNPQGAYLRYKDAVDHVPDDPDARFALAQAADKLNKRDEAIANYQQTLAIDPDGDHDKASRAALKRLGVTPK